jgi:hypothetical protein
MIYRLLCLWIFSSGLIAIAATPSVENYQVGPKNLPALQGEGGPFAVIMDEQSRSLSMATGFPVATVTYGLWSANPSGESSCVKKNAVSLTVMDSPAYATVHRMQYGQLSGCFERIKVRTELEPARSLDGFLAKAGSPGCPFGQLVVLVPDANGDRFVVMFVVAEPGEIDAKMLNTWIRTAAAKFDFKTIRALPVIAQ